MRRAHAPPVPEDLAHFVRIDREEPDRRRHFVVHAADPRFTLELEADGTAPDGVGSGVIRRLCVPNSWAGDYGKYAKLITAAFYGRGPKYSYYNGCSTGGRQGLIEATRFPEDFDAILAGDELLAAQATAVWTASLTRIAWASIGFTPTRSVTRLEHRLAAPNFRRSSAAWWASPRPKACS